MSQIVYLYNTSLWIWLLDDCRVRWHGSNVGISVCCRPWFSWLGLIVIWTDSNTPRDNPNISATYSGTNSRDYRGVVYIVTWRPLFPVPGLVTDILGCDLGRTFFRSEDHRWTGVSHFLVLVFSRIISRLPSTWAVTVSLLRRFLFDQYCTVIIKTFWRQKVSQRVWESTCFLQFCSLILEPDFDLGLI